jgi:hypothetical protein
VTPSLVIYTRKETKKKPCGVICFVFFSFFAFYYLKKQMILPMFSIQFVSAWIRFWGKKTKFFKSGATSNSVATQSIFFFIGVCHISFPHSCFGTTKRKKNIHHRLFSSLPFKKEKKNNCRLERM